MACITIIKTTKIKKLTIPITATVVIISEYGADNLSTIEHSCIKLLNLVQNTSTTVDIQTASAHKNRLNQLSTVAYKANIKKTSSRTGAERRNYFLKLGVREIV
jgi:hypothetical protein